MVYLAIPVSGFLLARLAAFVAARWLKGLPEAQQAVMRPVVMSAFAAAIFVCFAGFEYVLWSSGKAVFPRLTAASGIAGLGFGVFWSARLSVLLRKRKRAA